VDAGVAPVNRGMQGVVVALCVLTSSTRVYRPSMPAHLDHPPSLVVSIPVFWGTAAF
jgi:hypothetical protein